LPLQDCVNPQAVQLIPSKAVVAAGEKLAVLATVTDATPAPLDNVLVTFTTSFQLLQAADSQQEYSKDSYGYHSAPAPAPAPAPTPAGPPVTTTSTALTNALGQALLLVSTPAAQSGQVTVQASVPTCTAGQVVTSNMAQISVLTSLADTAPPEQHSNHYGWDFWHPHHGSHRHSKSYEPHVGDKYAGGSHSHRDEHSTEHEYEEGKHHRDLDAKEEPSHQEDSYPRESHSDSDKHYAEGDASSHGGDDQPPAQQEHHSEERPSYVESPAYEKEDHHTRGDDDSDYKPHKEEHHKASGYSQEHEQSGQGTTEGGGSYVQSAQQDASVVDPQGLDEPASPAQ
jgi:hypothetical protein